MTGVYGPGRAGRSLAEAHGDPIQPVAVTPAGRDHGGMQTALETAPLPARIAAVCHEVLELARGARVLVAVSGGADSTALACLLAACSEHGLPLALVLGHVDHGWRGAAEAAADREVVEALAHRLGVPLVCAPAPPGDVARTEDAARRWRYRALGAIARAQACQYVATGHHAGDQAETFLMRLLRGSGSWGLAGIPRARPLHPDLTVIRPLLDEEPAALRAWLRTHHVAWREDPTNLDASRDRASVRARLEQRHTRTLAGLAARLRRRLERRLARLEAVAAREFVHHPHAAAVGMPRALLAALQPEDLALALRLAGERLDASREGPWFVRRHVARFASLLVRGGDLDLPRGRFLHVGGSTAWLAERAPPAAPLPRLARRDLARASFDLEAWRSREDGAAAAVDAEHLGGDAALRLLLPDDRFQPLGSGGPTRVDAWLARQGVPAFVRRGQLVVAGTRGVAWVVGRRLDAGHRVTETTRQVAILRLGAG